MGIFRRREGNGTRDGGAGAGGEPDASFPFLTSGQAARLRAITREQFAEIGIEVQIRADHLVAADGIRYGLHNLFATCHNTPGGERAWRDVVRSHVARLGRMGAEPPVTELTPEQLLERAVLRVCGITTLPGDLAAFGYHRPLGGDLVELVVCDGAEAVAYLTDREVERVGIDALRAAGLENLLREDFGQPHRVAGPRGSSIDVLVGDSVFTASRLLTMDDVLRRVTGDAAAPHGVLVAAPNRHKLAFHRLADASGLAALEGLARLAVGEFAAGVGAVSPHVFWRPPGGGELQQITRSDRPGEIVIRIDGEFEAVLSGLLG